MTIGAENAESKIVEGKQTENKLTEDNADLKTAVGDKMVIPENGNLPFYGLPMDVLDNANYSMDRTLSSMGDLAYAMVDFSKVFPRYFQFVVDSQPEIFEPENSYIPTFELEKEFTGSKPDEEKKNGYNIDVIMQNVEKSTILDGVNLGKRFAVGAVLTATNGATFTFSLQQLFALSRDFRKLEALISILANSIPNVILEHNQMENIALDIAKLKM